MLDLYCPCKVPVVLLYYTRKTTLKKTKNPLTKLVGERVLRVVGRQESEISTFNDSGHPFNFLPYSLTAD